MRFRRLCELLGAAGAVLQKVGHTELRGALRRMQRSGQRLAIVLGRDGHEIGIISLQDVLKIIFGDVSL